MQLLATRLVAYFPSDLQLSCQLTFRGHCFGSKLEGFKLKRVWRQGSAGLQARLPKPKKSSWVALESLFDPSAFVWKVARQVVNVRFSLTQYLLHSAGYTRCMAKAGIIPRVVLPFNGLHRIL